MYPIFTFVEMLLFAYFYYATFRSPAAKKAVLVLSSINAIGFLVYFFFAFFIFPVPPLNDSVSIGVETLLLIVFFLMYLYEEIKDTSTLFVYSKYSFWIAIGIMIYLAGSLFIYVFADKLPLKQVEKLWMFTNIFSIVKNIFFAVAIYTLANYKKSDTDNLIFSFENLN